MPSKRGLTGIIGRVAILPLRINQKPTLHAFELLCNLFSGRRPKPIRRLNRYNRCVSAPMRSVKAGLRLSIIRYLAAAYRVSVDLYADPSEASVDG